MLIKNPELYVKSGSGFFLLCRKTMTDPTITVSCGIKSSPLFAKGAIILSTAYSCERAVFAVFCVRGLDKRFAGIKHFI